MKNIRHEGPSYVSLGVFQIIGQKLRCDPAADSGKIGCLSYPDSIGGCWIGFMTGNTLKLAEQ